MLRKALAVLLIVSWVVLATVDLLEDIDCHIQAGLHSRAGVPVAKFGQGVNLVNNIVECADRPRVYDTELLEVASASVATNVTSLSKKAISLHKLHRVFLI